MGKKAKLCFFRILVKFDVVKIKECPARLEIGKICVKIRGKKHNFLPMLNNKCSLFVNVSVLLMHIIVPVDIYLLANIYA